MAPSRHRHVDVSASHRQLPAPLSETPIRQTYGSAIVTNPDVRAGARGHRSPKKPPLPIQIYPQCSYHDSHQSLGVAAEEGLTRFWHRVDGSRVLTPRVWRSPSHPSSFTSHAIFNATCPPIRTRKFIPTSPSSTFFPGQPIRVGRTTNREHHVAAPRNNGH
ncbi:hypothetical protein BDP81DRAFT_427797 [Colletotrichum phormii]|uniref:Uncharacterized protein n=1 Tax=Colletotrichum phormii TaxID=359342 RepID=A0AAI9ZTU2_9PEZI|nr:uncharacterized protein BDP81DRAFT_427797 [Colletotrichum phormii]KAK1636542.1 hypothetical protein BDP81DRAFT_427797 [Colletotrichum phormii]